MNHRPGFRNPFACEHPEKPAGVTPFAWDTKECRACWIAADAAVRNGYDPALRMVDGSASARLSEIVEKYRAKWMPHTVGTR